MWSYLWAERLCQEAHAFPYETTLPPRNPDMLPEDFTHMLVSGMPLGLAIAAISLSFLSPETAEKDVGRRLNNEFQYLTELGHGAEYTIQSLGNVEDTFLLNYL